MCQRAESSRTWQRASARHRSRPRLSPRAIDTETIELPARFAPGGPTHLRSARGEATATRERRQRRSRSTRHSEPVKRANARLTRGSGRHLGAHLCTQDTDVANPTQRRDRWPRDPAAACTLYNRVSRAVPGMRCAARAAGTRHILVQSFCARHCSQRGSQRPNTAIDAARLGAGSARKPHWGELSSS